jgi:RHS repeat-associated protein
MRSTGEALQPYVATGQTVSAGSLFAGEVNGDGLDDLLHVAIPSNSYSHFLHAGVVPDLLDRATDGFGNYTDFNYATLSSSGACYARSSPVPAYPERGFQDPLPVVCSASANNGIGGTYTVTYQYYNADVNLQGRGFAGFGAKLRQDSRNGLFAFEFFNLAFPYTGTRYQQDVRQPDNATLVSLQQSNWTTHSYGTGFERRFFPFIGNSTGQQREMGGSFNGVIVRSSTTNNTVDASTGTLTDTTTTVTEGNNANGLNAGASYMLRTYAPMLFNDFTNWCFGRPTRTEQINSHSLFGGAAQTRTVDTTWDGLSCRPTDSVIEPGNPTRQVTTQLTYDAFGNPATQTVTPVGGAARVTQFNWGSDGRFPRTLTNALSQVTTLDWWPELGQLRSTTDPNGLIATNAYDVFGRPTSEVAPDNTSTLVEYLPCDVDCSGFANTRYKIRSTLRDTGGGTIAQSFVLLDSLDRARRSASFALEGGLINQLTEYDALGRVARSSTPYFHMLASPVWTSFTYDLLDRTRQVSRDRTSDADSSASTSTFGFNGLTVTSTDPLGKVRVDTLDPLGQILRAVQASGSVDQSTMSYDYDAFTNLVRTTDGAGNQIVIGYDVRGFKTSSNDPDLGNWTYDYFPTGELKRQTDAKSQVTTFTYDKLSRPLMRVEPSEAGSGMQTTTWTWGSSAAAFNIGQLQSITLGTYSETYGYDNRSRLSSTTVVADGGTYVVGQSYNASTGLLEAITYPTSTGAAPFKVKYEYETANKSGLLLRVKDFNAGTVFWQAVSSNALGQYQDVTLGNGLKTLTAFDSVTGAINRVDTGPGGGNTRQWLQYSWDKVRNLTSRQDMNIAKTEIFTYDNLYRMIQAQVLGNPALTVAYNQLGNITSKSDLGSYSYHPTKKHAVTTAGPFTLTYDANGNIETQAGAGANATVDWTAYNLPKLISDAGGFSSTFLYGPDRQRYKHVAVSLGVSEATIYIKRIFEKLTRATGVEYKHSIIGPEGVFAIHNRKSSGTNETIYLLKDHLGSTDVITSSTGASLLKLSFGPFGERRNGTTWVGPASPADYTALSNTTRQAFTGHEQIDNLDLIHMNGRVFHPLLARFGSPDPFVQAPFNSQSLNRYSYVFNNPLKFTDPSGFCVPDEPQCDPPSPRTGLAPGVLNGGGPDTGRSQREFNPFQPLDIDPSFVPPRKETKDPNPSSSSTRNVSGDGSGAWMQSTVDGVAAIDGITFRDNFAGRVLKGLDDSVGLAISKSIRDGRPRGAISGEDLTGRRLEDAKFSLLTLGIGPLTRSAFALRAVRGPKATQELAQEIANAAGGSLRFRRTVALVETTQGPTLVAGGASDLSAAQKALAQQRGLTVVDDLPGADAEITAISGAGRLNLTPRRGVATNRVCPTCTEDIEGLGGRVDGRFFEFPGF